MSMPNYRAQFFNENSVEKFTNAVYSLKEQAALYATPYYSIQYHSSAMLYPFCYAIKTVNSLGRFAKGCLLLLEAFFNDPITSIPNVLHGMLKEFLTIMLNIINTIVAVIFFCTRSLATIFNLGYKINIKQNALLNTVATMTDESIESSVNPNADLESSSRYISAAKSLRNTIIDSHRYGFDLNMDSINEKHVYDISTSLSF